MRIATLFFLFPILASAQEPLPFLSAHDVVIFQGDSITDGGRERTGNDYNHIMGQDYAYILAAQVGSESPQRGLVFVNRGYGGEGVVDMAARWPGDMITLHPSLVSILIGINDFPSAAPTSETTEQFENIYDKLLGQMVVALPKTRIVLGEPFLLPVAKYKDHYAELRIALKERQEIVAVLGVKYHLPVIHYQHMFDEGCKKAPAEHWIWDGIHPTYAGAGLMAKEWLRVVDEFWGKP